MDWNEISATVANLNRWMRPLKALADIPEAVNAARAELARVEEATTLKKAEIEALAKEADRSKKKVDKIEEEFKKAWDERATQLNKEVEGLKDKLNLEIDDLIKQRDAEEKALASAISDQKAFRDKMAQEKAKMTEEIDSLKTQLEQTREAIAAILGK